MMVSLIILIEDPSRSYIRLIYRYINNALIPSIKYKLPLVRKRHQKQNNDIIRRNTLYATQLRKAELQKADLLKQNFELHEGIIHLMADLDRSKKKAATDASKSDQSVVTSQNAAVLAEMKETKVRIGSFFGTFFSTIFHDH